MKNTDKIDWTKFKGKKGATYERSKKSYVNFINAISNIDIIQGNNYSQNNTN